MTGIMQNHARKHKIPIDSLSYSFIMVDEEKNEISSKPEDGCYIHGLFIEGARWDKHYKSLMQPLPKELFSKMPVIHLLPVRNREQPKGGIYRYGALLRCFLEDLLSAHRLSLSRWIVRCPVYKILTRTGTLSTTGHSTNFIMWIDIPSNKPDIWRNALVSETNATVKFCDQDFWIKAGVACFCSLRY